MTLFKVVPICYERGWRLCDTHRAEQWAVAQFKGGRMFIRLRQPTKAKAESHLESTQRAYEGVRDSYRLGKRMGKKEIA